MIHFDMNERAWALADRVIERAAELRIAVHTLPGGARIIDAGVNVPGGFAAGAGAGRAVHGRPRARAVHDRSRSAARRGPA